MKIYKVTYYKYTNRGLVTEKSEYIVRYCSNEKELNKFLKNKTRVFMNMFLSHIHNKVESGWI